MDVISNPKALKALVALSQRLEVKQFLMEEEHLEQLFQKF